MRRRNFVMGLAAAIVFPLTSFGRQVVVPRALVGAYGRGPGWETLGDQMKLQRLTATMLLVERAEFNSQWREVARKILDEPLNEMVNTIGKYEETE